MIAVVAAAALVGTSASVIVALGGRGHSGARTADCTALAVPANSDFNDAYDPEAGLLRIDYADAHGDHTVTVDAHDPACLANLGVALSIARAQQAAREERAGLCASFKQFLASGATQARGRDIDRDAAGRFVAEHCTAVPTSAPSRAIRLERPGALALSSDGTLYIADYGRDQILARLPDGRFAVVAGTGRRGFGGDAGRALEAALDNPGGMAVANDGTIFFADEGNNRVRAISPRGIISTVAGNGSFGWVESGTPALAARLGGPTAITIGPDGDLYIAAGGANEVLRLTASRQLALVAGNRHFAGIYGVGGPATKASPDGPRGLAFDGAGNLFIAGFNTKTVLIVTASGTMTLPAGKIGSIYPSDGGLVTAPDGRVLATNHNTIVQLTPHRVRTILDFARNPIDEVGGFAAEGIAVDSSGVIYTDTYLGNGWARRTAFVAIDRNARARVLWAAALTPPAGPPTSARPVATATRHAYRFAAGRRSASTSASSRASSRSRSQRPEKGFRAPASGYRQCGRRAGAWIAQGPLSCWRTQSAAARRATPAASRRISRSGRRHRGDYRRGPWR